MRRAARVGSVASSVGGRERVGTDTAVLKPAPGIQLRPSRFAALVLVVGVLYALGAENAFWLEHEAAAGVAFFPAAGVTLAALAVTPPRRWPWRA